MLGEKETVAHDFLVIVGTCSAAHCRWDCCACLGRKEQMVLSAGL